MVKYMIHRRLIYFLLVVVTLLAPTSVSAAEGHILPSQSGISQTDHRPQWDDLGMQNVLAVRGQTTVAQPSTVRLTNNNPAGFGLAGCASQAMRRGWSVPLRRGDSRLHWRQGYIYLIQCLRL